MTTKEMLRNKQTILTYYFTSLFVIKLLYRTSIKKLYVLDKSKTPASLNIILYLFSH